MGRRRRGFVREVQRACGGLMVGLKSPAGSLVEVEPALAVKLIRQGWVSTDKPVDPKRPVGRPKKSE